MTHTRLSNEIDTPQQTLDGSEITENQQPTNHYNFQVLTTNHITTKLTSPNHDQRHKYHNLMATLHLTLKMTTAQVVETSVTNSLSKDYSHPDDHAKQTSDTPGFKPFTIYKVCLLLNALKHFSNLPKSTCNSYILILIYSRKVVV